MAAGGPRFEEVEIGDEIGPVERIVSVAQVTEFTRIWGAETGVSRFTDGEVARSEGLPGAIVPGAMTIALMSQLLTGWSPGITLRKLDVVFRQMVFHDTLLYIRVAVTDKAEADGGRLECDVVMEDAEGARLAIGRATVELATARPG